ncbi:lipocalin-like domain-containing protein [Rhizobium binxianense]
MRKTLALILATTLAGLAAESPALAAGANRYAGTWRMVSAQIDPQGANRPAYGANPHGWLVFTEELTFVEVLTDPSVPKFASNARGQGTDEENRRAMAGSIGFFGRYTLDENGEFNGNRVEGSTFPNWVGQERTREQLRMTVEGDRMTEQFRRPEGTQIRIIWERVR